MMTSKVTVTYDVSSELLEGKLRGKLIELGWTPPQDTTPQPNRTAKLEAKLRTIYKLCTDEITYLLGKDEANLLQSKLFKIKLEVEDALKIKAEKENKTNG